MVWHKQEKCSGVKRSTLERQLKEGGFKCNGCKSQKPPEVSNEEVSQEVSDKEVSTPVSNEVQVATEIENNKCSECRQILKSTTSKLSCSICQSVWHKQYECSGVRRFTLDKQIRDNTFKCKVCKRQQSTTTGMQQSQADLNNNQSEPFELPQAVKCAVCPSKLKGNFMVCKKCEKTIPPPDKMQWTDQKIAENSRQACMGM